MSQQSLLSLLPTEVFEKIFDRAFEGVAISEGGKLLYVNRGLAAMAGYKPEEMIGKDSFSFAPPDSYDEQRRNVLNGEDKTYISTGRRKDGSTLHVEIRGIQYQWNGKSLRLTTIRDITESVEAAKRLRESEARHRTIIESAEEGIWQVDREHKTVFVNWKMADYLGYTPDEMIGCPVEQFVPEEAMSAFAVRLAARRAGKREQYDIRYRRKDGTMVWMINSVAPLYDAEGRYCGALGMHTDISARRLAEEALRETNELFQSTFEQAAVGITHTTPEGRWLRFNRRFCEILGATPEQIEARALSDFLFPDDPTAIPEGYRRLLRGDISHFTTEVSHLRDDSSVIWLQVTASLVRGGGGEPKYFVTIMQDVTARKVAEEKLAMHRFEMLATSKTTALGEMASGIAHEINNPLAIIRAYTSVLRDALDSEPINREDVVAHADKIDSTVARITQIVRSVVAFTRNTEYEAFQVMPLHAIVRDTIDLCETRFRASRIELKCAPIPEDLALECRPVPISQVLMNLLHNAADAVDGCPVKWIYIGVEDQGDSLTIRVEDSGPGVPLEMRDRIMHPFFTTKPSRRGTGLGLSISRKIVESHSGTLSLDPEAPYTRFVVRLPKSQRRNFG
jgi:PAS domain S-box-containing protein